MFFIYAIAFWSLIITLIINIGRIRKQTPSKKRYSYLYILLICSPLILGIGVSNFHQINKKVNLKPDKTSIFIFDSTTTTIDESKLQDSVEADFFRVKNHIIYISTHYQLYFKSSQAGTIDSYYPNAGIKNYYSYKSESLDSNYSERASWALGIIFYYENEYDSCIRVLKKHLNMPYTNLFLGLSFRNKGMSDSAAYHYLGEYNKSANILPDSLKNELLYTINHSSNINETIIQACYLPKLSTKVTDKIKREVFFVKHDWLNYFSIYYKDELNNILSFDFLVSIIVISMWIVYLILLDVFQKQKWKYMLFIILLSAVLSLTLPFCYEYFHYIHHWDISGNAYEDLIYCIFAIGLFEETLKIIPFLMLMLFTKEPNESYNYIFYSALCGLGFALMENTLYFQMYGGPTIMSRALTSTVAHVFFSSLTGYGLLVANQFNKNKWLYGVGFFCIAMVSHGIYDWLLFYHFNFFFYLGFFASIMIWFIFVNNALNVSIYFSLLTKIKYKKIEYVFVIFLIVILIAQYLLDHFINQSENALGMLWTSVFFTTFFLLFFVSRIGKMDLVQGYWRKISLVDNYNATGNNNFFDFRVILVNFFVVNAIQPMNYFGLKVKLLHNYKVANNALKPDAELKGTIMERVQVMRYKENGNSFIDTHYFWIQLEEAIHTGQYVTNVILAKQIDSFENVENGTETNVSIIGLNVSDGIILNKIDEVSTYFIGYALIILHS